ncbi:ATP-dependent zinc protease [Methylonatrum kenyense]|uniref:ATP-dependent zinc protease family protein n=1 Tax=Methylonatrum kenyense TaxID=455253 RepID=UPI0020BEF765|nr:ATP-dependent zinc protease [Methylonatrum kenyense]MCK8515453.1 ATP-dependent zinc protease [Methylonatrum kenyense]
MPRFLILPGLLLATLPLILAAGDGISSAELEEQEVLGHVEDVRLMPDDIPAQARLDTGARRSSLHARDIETFDKDGEDWVRFLFDDHDGGKHDFELPLEDEIEVTQASGQETRYVVKIGLCVADQYEETDFTLTDRSALTYPILVGRTFLSEGVLVSSEHDRTVKPGC